MSRCAAVRVRGMLQRDYFKSFETILTSHETGSAKWNVFFETGLAKPNQY
jgi:hypothetical protein